ncbi:mobile mystery protein A [Parasulfitobacter algicola]|uniref:Mobile mystery protein A n=1 Tax=Parasulfitobacter algicola TaxID=2614809 RepID=A0ABX2IR15_9RHOB|nr:mobile mystery protein A [Sulfitobacter algicola]NSX54800.1 mobile mystery protein A [Sulfitobacter algicola]
MNVKDTARRQYLRLVDNAAKQLRSLRMPANGWLVTVRKALGMSGAEVAARMGVSRNAIYQAERNERDQAITIAQMEKVAAAMGCRFVYAVVPEKSLEDVIRAQAFKKAEARIRRVSAHMSLEQQSLTKAQTDERIAMLAQELVRDMPPDFWEVK